LEGGGRVKGGAAAARSEGTLEAHEHSKTVGGEMSWVMSREHTRVISRER